MLAGFSGTRCAFLGATAGSSPSKADDLDALSDSEIEQNLQLQLRNYLVASAKQSPRTSSTDPAIRVKARL